LFQTKYRVAVAYQNVAWESGSSELSKLFQRMKDEECRRRTSLRELLVAFVQRQQRLFLSFPAIQNPLLEQLVERQIDPKAIEESVQAAIGAGQITGDFSKNKHSNGQGLAKASSEEESDFTLESPLTSDLICKAQVVERQHLGVLKGWKASLAVITSDSYLHFFDLPPERVKQGLEPEVAFQSLVPIVIIPTWENFTMGKSNFSKGWGDLISPSESIVLGNCVIQPRGDSSFEIIETIATTGASKMFGKTVSRKMILRTPSKMETDEWINLLKSPLA
jgi:hypothetical protein